MYFVARILFKLRNNEMFSEMGKQIRKQYKITSSQMFFNHVKVARVKVIFGDRYRSTLSD